jgi:hypothetical protein
MKWYQNSQQIIFEYFQGELKELGFSWLYKPFFVLNFMMYEENMEPKIQSQMRKLTEEYKKLFGIELSNETTITIINVVLFDVSQKQPEMEDTQIERTVAWHSPLTSNYYTIKIPINHTVGVQPGESLVVRFNFRKNIYLKNNIQSYYINPYEKRSTNNVRDEDRGKFLNNFDLKQIRDNLEKIINERMIPLFENLLFSTADKLAEIKRSKKKSIWSFFAPNSTPTSKGEIIRERGHRCGPDAIQHRRDVFPHW